jgi:hypothetical protein
LVGERIGGGRIITPTEGVVAPKHGVDLVVDLKQRI